MKCPCCGKVTHCVSKEEMTSRYYCTNPQCDEVGEIIILKPVGLMHKGKWVPLGKDGFVSINSSDKEVKE